MSAHRPPFPVRPEKAEALRRRMESLGILERDLEESFFRSAVTQRAGRRAQNGVEIFHPRSGLRVRCAKSTSQALNRFLARRDLVRRIERPCIPPLDVGTSATLPFPTPPVNNPLEELTRLFAGQPDAPHLSRLRDLFRSVDDRPCSQASSSGFSLSTPERRRDPRPPGKA